MLVPPNNKFQYRAVKDADFRWLSFIEGNIYEVHRIKYSNGQVDETHVAVEGIFKHKDGKQEQRKVLFSKQICKEYLELLKPQNDENF